MGYSTLKLFWPTLEDQELVTHVRTIGKAKMYTLNQASPIVKGFKDFYWTVTKHGLHQRLEEHILVH